MAKTVHKLWNEALLFQQLSEGSEQAFDVIYHHYNKRLAPFVEKMVHSPELSEEIIQDIFVHIWTNRSLFAKVKHPTAYLFNVASNKALDYIKKIASDERLKENVTYYAAKFSNETEERIYFRESAEIVNQAVAQLPEQRRRIYEMSRIEGLSNDEIAEQLNISKNTVANQLVTAMKTIRIFVEQRANLFSYAIFVLLTHK